MARRDVVFCAWLLTATEKTQLLVLHHAPETPEATEILTGKANLGVASLQKTRRGPGTRSGAQVPHARSQTPFHSTRGPGSGRHAAGGFSKWPTRRLWILGP